MLNLGWLCVCKASETKHFMERQKVPSSLDDRPGFLTPGPTSYLAVLPLPIRNRCKSVKCGGNRVNTLIFKSTKYGNR